MNESVVWQSIKADVEREISGFLKAQFDSGTVDQLIYEKAISNVGVFANLNRWMESPDIDRISPNAKRGILSASLKIYDYEQAQRVMMSSKRQGQDYPTVFVGWDNSPRRGENGIIIINQTPQIFEGVLRDTIGKMQAGPIRDKIIFLNAWNEWAEGNHLEPDLKFGHAFLQAVQRATQTT